MPTRWSRRVTLAAWSWADDRAVSGCSSPMTPATRPGPSNSARRTPTSTRSRRLSLDRAGHHPLDEEALEREEHDERDDQRQERPGRQHVDVRTELPRLTAEIDRQRLGARIREDQADQQVVPDPQELEDAERRDRRQPEREHHGAEDAPLRRTVHAGGLEQLAGYADEEVPKQEYRERQPERHVEQHDARNRAEYVQVAEQLRDRYQGDLDRHDEQADDDDEQHIPTRELQPRECIGRHRSDDDDEQRRRHRDQDRVEER